MDNQSKLKEIHSTLGAFFDQFTLDAHGIIVLECFLEELYGKAVLIPGEARQEGNATTECVQRSEGNPTN